MYLVQAGIIGFYSGGQKCMPDVYRIPSMYVYMMMSWLHKEPMKEHIAVEWIWLPWKCLQMLSLQFLQCRDGCNERPET